MLKRFAAIIGMIMALSGGVAAHHGWGSYDANRKFIIRSEVKHLLWQNPHVHIQLEHEKATWTIVLAPVSRMQLRGLSPELIKDGTAVAAEGYPSRRVEHEMRAERIRVKDKTYELR
jgi:hypothetical protein